MDLYQSPLLDAFTECTLTDHACYPPLASDPRYPPLDRRPEQLWQSNLLSEPEKLSNLFTGMWYLSAGLNPAFDTFDCQTHEFSKPNANVKNGGILIADATFSYRIQLSNDGKWFPRTGDKRLTLVYEDSSFIPNGKWRGWDQGLKWGIDSFLDEHYDNDVKSKSLPASSTPINDNVNVNTKSPRLVLTLRPDLMNYKDDWVVLQSSPEYIVLLYHGTNSAWEGYGGLNVYTRTRTISDTLKRDVERGLSKVNLSLRDLTIVDNSCPKE
jgi:violaxanthin de-epoxidase